MNLGICQLFGKVKATGEASHALPHCWLRASIDLIKVGTGMRNLCVHQNSVDCVDLANFKL